MDSGGRRRAAFGASGLYADSRTPHWGLGMWRALLRAVAGCSISRLPKETTIDFHIRMMPRWEDVTLKATGGLALGRFKTVATADPADPLLPGPATLQLQCELQFAYS